MRGKKWRRGDEPQRSWNAGGERACNPEREGKQGGGGGRPVPLAAEDLLCCLGSKDGLSSWPLPKRVTAVAAAPPARAARAPQAIPAIINFCLIRVIVQTWAGQYD